MIPKSAALTAAHCFLETLQLIVFSQAQSISCAFIHIHYITAHKNINNLLVICWGRNQQLHKNDTCTDVDYLENSQTHETSCSLHFSKSCDGTFLPSAKFSAINMAHYFCGYIDVTKMILFIEMSLSFSCVMNS